MSRPLRMTSLTLAAAIALLIAVANASAASLNAELTSQHDPALMKQYTAQWGAREQAAKTPEDHVALAKDLYNAAEHENDRDMKLLLLDMTWSWGDQDCPQGYYYAAQAAQKIRKIDPTRRVQSLERLAYLFRMAWERNRQKFLGNGIELANVKMQTADQRLMDLFADRHADRIDRMHFIAGLNRCKHEYVEAYAAAHAVISTAKNYARVHPNPQARVALDDFVNENEPLLKRIAGGRDNLLAFAADYARKGDAAIPDVPDPKAKAKPASPPESKPVEVASAKPTPKPTTPTDAAPTEKPSTPDQPTQSDNPPAVASTPPPAQTTDAKPADTTIASADHAAGASSGPFHMIRCEKCGEMFVPEFGQTDHICYWCKHEMGFFRIDDGKK